MTIRGDTSYYFRMSEANTNADISRKFAFGTNWYGIRLGILINCEYPDGTTTGSTDCAWGICSGTANTYGSASCANFLGYQFQTFGTTNSATQIGSYDKKRFFNPAGSNAGLFVKKHNTSRSFITPTSSSGGGSPAVMSMASDGLEYDLSMHFLEIWKPLNGPSAAGTNWTMHLWSTGSDSNFYRGRTVTAQMWETVMEYPQTLNGLNGSTSGATPARCQPTNIAASTVDEATHGALDSFNLVWNGAIPSPWSGGNSGLYPLRIHRVGVKKMF